MRVKDPVGALASFFNRAPVPFASRSESGYRSASSLFSAESRTTQLEATRSVGTLYQVVSSLATNTSRVEWHMHRKRRRNVASATCPLCEQPGVELIEDHQALRVWSRPNDFMSGQRFVESFQQHIDLTGEGYWVLESLEGLNFPTGMWYVRPDRMHPIKSPSEYLVGWVYRGPDSQEIPLELEQVVQLQMPDPNDPYRGLGPVQAILTDVASDRAAAEYNRNFFLNSALPGGMIEVPTQLDDNAFRRLLQQWREQHRGVSNAHRVGVLEAGAKWVERSVSNKDMQFTALRTLSRDIIREAFGFPKFAAGIVEDVNRASAEASSAWYTQSLIVPRLDRIKDALNYQYLPRFGTTGTGVEFAYCDPAPKDAEAENKERESKTGAYKTLVDAGVDPDDAAMIVGLPPMRNNRNTQQQGVTE